MESQQLSNWIQTLTAIAVIAGLGLVVWELRQSREVAQAQLYSDAFSIRSERLVALMGENSAEVLEKACYHPKDLTSKDTQILNVFFHGEILLVRRARRISETTDFYDEFDWEEAARDNFYQILGYPYGRYWWGRIGGYLHTLDPELVAIGNEMARDPDISKCSEYTDGYLEWLNEFPEHQD